MEVQSLSLIFQFLPEGEIWTCHILNISFYKTLYVYSKFEMWITKFILVVKRRKDLIPLQWNLIVSDEIINCFCSPIRRICWGNFRWHWPNSISFPLFEAFKHIEKENFLRKYIWGNNQMIDKELLLENSNYLDIFRMY